MKLDDLPEIIGEGGGLSRLWMMKPWHFQRGMMGFGSQVPQRRDTTLKFVF